MTGVVDYRALPHRVDSSITADVINGVVNYSPVKSIWFLGNAVIAIAGGVLMFSWSAFAVFVCATAFVLLFGHSLGNHRKLVHDSFQCPKWLEYALVYAGVQVGLAGPLGLLRQHDLRDYAQRQPECHSYLRHGSTPLKDAWWQLNCDLYLERPPVIELEARLTEDRVYRWLQRTWMLQQIPPAVLFYALGGWPLVIWGVCARIATGVFGHWLIGYFAHNHGAMEFYVRGAAVQGRNIRLTSLLTMGECWHNNHHAFPGSARLGLKPGEWDPGWWVLIALARVHLVWHVITPDKLDYRPELECILPNECAVHSEFIGTQP
jgi:stearoyl-CoA desaturase (delta-9 desaturase)